MDPERIKAALAMFIEMVSDGGKNKVNLSSITIERMHRDFNPGMWMVYSADYKYAIYFDNGNYMEADGV